MLHTHICLHILRQVYMWDDPFKDIHMHFVQLCTHGSLTISMRQYGRAEYHDLPCHLVISTLESHVQ